MIRVLLVDDHPVVLAGLRAAFAATSDIRLAGFITQGSAAEECVRRHLPDVVLVDVQMPDVNGVEVARRLHDAVPACNVLALSAFSVRPIIIEMLEAGALGYVLKDSFAEEIVEAVRTVAAGEVFVSPCLRDGLPRRLLGPGSFEPPRLTPREREVVRLIAQGKTCKEVAAALGLSPRTVEYHRHQAMARLEMDNLADLVKYAMAMGWLLDREP